MSTTFRDLSEDQLCRILQEADHMCYREIAVEMDVPLGTVKGVLRRARRNHV
ncbi:hypothetical protein [Methanomethylovorans hollandica]|uniref:hypothetical protein n=1 Tax=Methanomethylovorans hollandica TaxID=101192 RepID=UPI0012EA7D9D|nr:hypothetical protein [Methanomethylovorans hollandica]